MSLWKIGSSSSGISVETDFFLSAGWYFSLSFLVTFSITPDRKHLCFFFGIEKELSNQVEETLNYLVELEPEVAYESS